MTNHTPRPLTDHDYAEIQAIWRRIKALRALRDAALPHDAPGAWIRSAAEQALDQEWERLNRLYAETHPTLPALEPRWRER